MRPLLLFLLVTVAPLAAQAPSFRQVADLIPGDAGPVLGLADFDQDGDLDLLTNGTGIYLNDGNGTFTPHPVLSAITVWPAPPGTPLTVAGQVHICAIGDFTGDGAPDAVVSGPAPSPLNYTSTLYLWVNQGNGVLANAGLVNPSVMSPMALASGDVDADGDLDLVVSHVSSASTYPGLFPLLLLLNNGAGAFTAAAPAQMPAALMAPRQLALRDFDGDGLTDLVAGVFAYAFPASPPLLFLNGPSGAFATAGITVPASPAFDAFAVGDIDGDGLADLVLDTSPPWSIWTCVAPNAPPPLVLISTGGGGFWPAYSAITGPLTMGMPKLVDLTADGVPDLLRLTYRGAEVYPLSSTTAFALTAQPAVFLAPDDPVGGGGYGVSSAVGDLDGDGDQDVVVFTAQGNEVIFNDSSGSPVATNGKLAASRRTGPQTWSAADVDGDGDEDLILGFADCGGGTQVDVAWNDGRGNLTEGASLPCPSCGAVNTLGPRVFFDADQDGDIDAFVGPWGTPTPMPPYKVLINSGGALVVSQTFLPPAPNACFSIAAGDVDGDGDIDVVGGRGFVFKNDGAGSFQLTGGASVYAIRDIALADLDGDGDLDAAFTGAPSGLMINDGTGSFTLSSLAAFPPCFLVEAADLDGDGDTDLLFETAVYMNLGGLSFTQAGVVPLVNWYSGNVGNNLRTADVDGDGDQDILDSGWLYRNSGTGSFSAVEAFPGLGTQLVVADFDRDGDPDLVRNGPRILTNMTRQLSRGLPARPGRPASLEIGGPPGAAWELYASPGTTSFPLPPFGTVRLDLAGLQLAFSGTIGANGLSTVTGIVPATPGIVGLSVYWQAVIHHPYGPRLTGLEVTTVAAF